ncbi:MAG: 50S ribosomal protein L24 [Candidatus Magasanikbacteria bacterium CG10_big_fil_rev_8_21_14_0_10_43_6]|uniref:Large ribosomal subunit protein uL24 n=1 Tax=Candidatus Magasanikbacteria bacterium CG10_big_fil_rev_8_21_14_0_10_43_6 TaxID=1974650 RepID=A0A2M6W0A8_9BACT|nr:MAG: 50S ribosomal protein L24 [Candidatus Magasanikbacteria bacterium CG10_big_fil_rev_8_21_14_0_10_43_6]
MHIKTGDNVKVLAGKEKGKTGKVGQVLFNKKNKKTYVVIDGLNIRKKHMRSGQRGQSGQIIELPGPIHVSNVMVIDPKTSAPTRVGYAIEGTTKKRVAKKSGEYLD